jgi:FixJ family two-component response regulator
MDRTLLLVDDEENIVSALTRLLRRDGYRILRATSGEEGLKMLADHSVGVIVSDQRMPGMTGVEFLSKVREGYPETIRIVLSGYTELESVTDAINRGAIYKFLTKPWEDDLLRANIDEAFRRYEMKRENQRLTEAYHLANEELSRMNEELERRVEEQTRAVLHNLRVLQVSQEVLDHLPLAVVGVDDEGLIAFVNRAAARHFDPAGQGLLGEAARDRLPGQLLDFTDVQRAGEHESELLQLDDGRRMHCWCHAMGESSLGRGKVLVAGFDTD